ncbi:MAG TPA: PQQ-binding-like beta-propeller repeat protein [Vicinamibacterales bacterium]|nr:PQQ-binding-like beta-propeller repeat protein [Vicinamibacterales bacterium]
MRTRLLSLILVATAGLAVVGGNDWPEWRGPSRDGSSTETNLPERWSPTGENVAWSKPFGGRSTPVVFGNRLYLQTITTQSIATTQERLIAMDADTGAVVWERRVNDFHSDVRYDRAAWASPAVDTATGNIYMFTGAAELVAFAPDGRRLWDRSLPEEYGAITTHGGRTTSPIIEGDKVILNTLIQNWGPDLGRPGNRYFAFDKRTGQTIWVSSPQARHWDTNYSTPIVVDVNGSRLIIVGGTDGVFHALQLNTGKPVWNYEVSKRAILNSVLFRDNIVYVTHGEENIDTTEMGMIAAIDATGSGPVTPAGIKWVTHGFLPSYASPVMDATRLYTMDNSAIMGAFDLKTGKEVWTKRLGISSKASPILADGKLYVGTESGKFYILRPTANGADTLDEDLIGTAANPEPIVASAAVSGGRIFVTTMAPGEPVAGSAGHLYAIGPKTATRNAGKPVPAPPTPAASTAPVAQVQVFPYEALLNPGAKQPFTLRLYDAKGNFIRNAPASEAQWTLDLLGGTVGADGVFVAPATGSAGFVKATVGDVAGQARVRVVPPLPWTFDFEGLKAAPMWWTSNLKGVPNTIDGSGVIVRPRDDTVGRRTRFFMGRPDWSNYTVEADVRGTEMRRQRGDIGLINQRYALVLFGNGQHLEIHPWQAVEQMTVRVDKVAWDVNTWYRMKLRVENRPDGSAHVQGKVWKRDQPEPAAWMIEKVDRIGHMNGAPGIYADGISDVMFDNLKVYKNQ